MAIIDFPDQLPSSVNWQIVTNTRRATSPFTKTSKFQQLDGTRFVASLTFDRLDQAETRLLQAFLFEAEGPINTFYIRDPLFNNTLDNYGTVTCGAGPFNGKSLATTGWTSNGIVVIPKGSYIEVDGQFRGVTKDVIPAGGAATIRLSHKFYVSPAGNSDVNYITPRCEMRLLDDNQARRQTKPPFNSNFAISVEEVIKI